MKKKLSPAQAAVLKYMQDGHATWIAWYKGEWGTEGRGAGLYFRKKNFNTASPKLTCTIVSALLVRGLLVEEDCEFKLSKMGKEFKL